MSVYNDNGTSRVVNVPGSDTPWDGSNPQPKPEPFPWGLALLAAIAYYLNRRG